MYCATSAAAQGVVTLVNSNSNNVNRIAYSSKHVRSKCTIEARVVSFLRDVLAPRDWKGEKSFSFYGSKMVQIMSFGCVTLGLNCLDGRGLARSNPF